MEEPRKNFQYIRQKAAEKFHLEHWQIIALLLGIYDVIAINVAFFLALWVRFDCAYTHIPENFLLAYAKFTPVYTVFCLLVFWVLRLYNSVWRFAGFSEIMRVLSATVITGIFHAVAITAIFERMPIAYYIFGTSLQFVFCLAVRFSYRLFLIEKSRRQRTDGRGVVHRVMLIGAGMAGQMILQEVMHGRKMNAEICCIIDDNPNKWDRYIDGVPIVGGRDDILLNADKYRIDQIYFAAPSASAEDKRDILNICKETGCEMKILPGIYQLVNDEVSVSQMKSVAVEDLLGRDPITVNNEEIFDYISGKVILVTGGGGSIGSELCRQIAKHSPKRLIIFDVYENNAYDIEQELKRTCPDLKLTVLIGSVRDSKRVNYLFATYHPDIVYHAAAHKHVPLMETSPCEAIKNNVMGTYKTARAAMEHGCRRFVLISTDKAVNPTNIMGASKRLCEMVIQSMNTISKEGKIGLLPFLNAHFEDDESLGEGGQTMTPPGRTEYVAVRFGNVLGSNGSVIPLFRKQIENGGPVTVTHPDIIRYFMTIPEAVSLVLQAGSYAKGGEIFILDMGAPVKIDTLARNLIKLSGYKPDVDIKIVYTGLRPGEKLYEEKLMAEEGLTKTSNKLIHIGKPIPFDVEKFLKQLEGLARASYNNSSDINRMVEEIVPTYHPADEKKEMHSAVYEKLLDEAVTGKE